MQPVWVSLHTLIMSLLPTILIVEDESLIALEIELGLEAEGYDIVGPIGSVDAGLQLIEHIHIDAAILDIDLGDGKNSFEIADNLIDRGIPIMFHTGRVPFEGLADRFSDVTILSKPTYLPKIIAKLQCLVPHPA